MGEIRLPVVTYAMNFTRHKYFLNCSKTCYCKSASKRSLAITSILYSHRVRTWKNHPLNYASAKKVRKSAIDESNSVAAQQREDRRRRLCKWASFIKRIDRIERDEPPVLAVRLFIFRWNRKNSGIMQIRRLSVWGPAALVDLPRSL